MRLVDKTFSSDPSLVVSFVFENLAWEQTSKG